MNSFIIFKLSIFLIQLFLYGNLQEINKVADEVKVRLDFIYCIFY